MEDTNMSLKEQQVEALQVLTEYSVKLIKGMKTSAEELMGCRKEDTDEFLRMVLDGVNWELNVLNGCLSLINEEEEVLDKNRANETILDFQQVFSSKNDEAISKAITEKLIPLVEQITEAAQKTVNKNS
ncbi:MAG: hypothetical protein ACI4EW_03575 [Butyrivibrio sp.]